MGVSRSNLDQIRSALNPLDIIREAVPTLKQAGNRWRGLCPFHNERTPSFYFMPDKGLWHCFGSCQEGGDIFKFVMRLDNLTFPEALRQLAQRAGVELQWENRGGEAASRETQERERLVALLAEAAAFYNEALRKSAEAEPARKHLAKRKIRPETVEKFQLGYSPFQGSFLDAALKKGRPIEDLVRSGLAARSEKTGRYHDPLRQRLIFPIFDAYGRPVAFGGRTLDDEQGPKYLNSPETPVYTKGRHLYGLFQGRQSLREKSQAVVVEGYMDVVGCHQGGATHAVAPLGTAFTKEQGQLLKRYVQEVVLLFDPDPAGTRASWRSADVLLQQDLFVRVGQVPDGKDPDELILEKGLGALEDVLKGALDVVDFWLDVIGRSVKSQDGLHERVRRAQELLQFIKGVPSEILRREWLKKIAQRLALDEASLWREFQKLGGAPAGAPANGQSAPRPAPPAGPQLGRPPSAPAKGPFPPPVPALGSAERRAMRMRSLEEEILQLLCNHKETWPALEAIQPALFPDERCRRTLEALRRQWAAQKALDIEAAVSGLPAEDTSWLSALLAEEKDFEDPEKTLSSRLHRLDILAAERERQALQQEVLRMLEGRAPKDESKISHYQTLTRKLKGIVRTNGD
jgi:DNA primase